ncbi:unnamed protein product, partial [Vitis vinifera]|uniref:Uncharacterized protein n=1 Tax=Vitis vinifera TaxID=29760 RepID=D7TF96_VITVI
MVVIFPHFCSSYIFLALYCNECKYNLSHEWTNLVEKKLFMFLNLEVFKHGRHEPILLGVVILMLKIPPNLLVAKDLVEYQCLLLEKQR